MAKMEEIYRNKKKVKKRILRSDLFESICPTLVTKSFYFDCFIQYKREDMFLL